MLEEKTITRAELKAIFGIGETTLCRWVNQGRLPAPTHIGRKTFWFKASIEKVLTAMRVKSEKAMRI